MEDVRVWFTRRPPKSSRAYRMTRPASTRSVPRRMKPQPSGKPRRGRGAQPWLLAGLKAQETFLQATVVFFQSAPGQQTLSRAAEWMLDNFYLAQQSLRQIREDMPQGFYRQLPKLAAGPMAGYPRIYDVAQQLMASSDARLDMEQVQRFVWLYQDIRPLTTGELWALPVMLRLSILAALAQAAGQITNLTQQVADPRQKGEPPSRPLSGSLTGDEIVANCFTSLRTIGTYDWRHFFESVSRVEQILSDDPAAVYAGMDRATRDQYRHVVEELALAAGQSELEVARMANALAQAAWTDPPAALEPAGGKDQGDAAAWPGLDMPPAAHVGYYLLDDGRAALEEPAGLSALTGTKAGASGTGAPHRRLLWLDRAVDVIDAGRSRDLCRRLGWLNISGVPGRSAGHNAGTCGFGCPGRLGCHHGCATPDSA